jgi:hypothetical protein
MPWVFLPEASGNFFDYVDLLDNVPILWPDYGSGFEEGVTIRAVSGNRDVGWNFTLDCNKKCTGIQFKPRLRSNFTICNLKIEISTCVGDKFHYTINKVNAHGVKLYKRIYFMDDDPWVVASLPYAANVSSVHVSYKLIDSVDYGLINAACKFFKPLGFLYRGLRKAYHLITRQKY